jgi:sodium/bile acid transporter family protein
MSFLAKGDVAFSVGMTTVSTVLAPVMTPLWMTYLVGQTVEMDGWGMFKFMLLVTLLPVVIGSAANILLHNIGLKTYARLCLPLPLSRLPALSAALLPFTDTALLNPPS